MDKIPRNASGVYSLPSNSVSPAVSGTVIESAPWNALTADLESDLNTARPVVAGGTGAANATAARTNLGLGSLATLSTITAAQITAGTITATELAADAVTTAKILDDAVDADKLAASSVVFGSIAAAALASQAEAEAGTAEDKILTPLRVSQAITALAFTTLSTSSALTFPSASSVSWAHGLGAAPAADRFGFYCVWKGGAVNGFTDGDILSLAGTGDDDASGMMCLANATNVKFAAEGPQVRDADGAGFTTLSSSNVDLYLWVRS